MGTASQRRPRPRAELALHRLALGRARESGAPLVSIEPQLAVIGGVSGERAARPFRDTIVGVREMVLLQPLYRQVFFERFGYESPAYGQVHPQSLLRTSQHTHAGAVRIFEQVFHLMDQFQKCLRVFGAQVQLTFGFRGQHIDPCPTVNGADIERGARLPRQADSRKLRHQVGEFMHRRRLAII